MIRDLRGKSNYYIQTDFYLLKKIFQILNMITLM